MAKKKTEPPPRRSAAEVKEIYEQAKALVDGGMDVRAACAQVGLAPSVYHRWDGAATGDRAAVRGSVSASSLPPRPAKKAGRGYPRIDMNDVGSLARRISTLDRKIAAVQDSVEERERLAERLLILLQPKQPSQHE